jgi:5'-3' exonuclease
LSSIPHTINNNIYNLSKEVSNPVSPLMQLIYVLPQSAHNLLPIDIRNLLSQNKYMYLFPENAPLHWAFTRWLWESKVQLPSIPDDLMIF